MIRERTGEDRKRAMAEGVKFGRKRKQSDYHRAEAVKDLTAAMHELHPHHHATEHASTSKTKPQELQKLSDAQLKEAIATLEGVHKQLSGHKTGNVHKAAGHVSHAIGELKEALTIK